MSTVECPKLNSLDSPPVIITAKTLQELQLSTYNRTVGTEVSLSCLDGRVVYGQNTVSCQPDGQWNFQQKPTCVLIPKGSPGLATTGPTRSADSLTQEQQIVIGVVVGAGGLVLIFLLAIIIALLCRSRRDPTHEKPTRGISTSELYGFRAHSPATQETNLDGYSLPETRMNGDLRGSRHVSRYHGNSSVSSFPGHLPGRAWTTRDSNHVHGSLPTLLPHLSHVTMSGSQGQAERSRANSVRTSVVSGLSDSRRFDVFNRLALLRGHDPFLWKPGSESGVHMH